MIYTCSHCDAQFSKWHGRCPECGSWGTVAESGEGSGGGKASAGRSKAIALGDVLKEPKNSAARIPTGWADLDTILGGGLVAGSATLIAGEPGVGKSTLALQLAKHFQGATLYISGEENEGQVAERAVRLGMQGNDKLRLLAADSVQDALHAIDMLEPGLIVIDSVQTIIDGETDGVAGSPAQVKAVCGRLVSVAKKSGIPIVLIGHVTKDGSIAGPKTLEHLVDTVCYFESDQTERYRLLKLQKHRFGPTDRIAVWELAGSGLQAVSQMETVFLAPAPSRSSRVLGVMVEGQRPFLLEVQALVTKTSFPYPERTVTGYDQTRLKMLIAVLQRYGNVSLRDDDVFVNVVGGWKAQDPALDAAVLAALALAKRPGQQKLVVAIGEAGLDGSLRASTMMSQRLEAATRMDGAIVYAAGGIDQEKFSVVHQVSDCAGLVSALVTPGAELSVGPEK